jgi:hypothetical protein
MMKTRRIKTHPHSTPLAPPSEGGESKRYKSGEKLNCVNRDSISAMCRG